MKLYPAKKYGPSIEWVLFWGFDVTDSTTQVGLWPTPVLDEGTVYGFGFVDLIVVPSLSIQRFYGPITIKFKELKNGTRTHNTPRLDKIISQGEVPYGFSSLGI